MTPRKGIRRIDAPQLTLLLVPSGDQGVRGISVPARLARLLPAAGWALAALGVLFGASYVNLARGQGELRRLRQERRALEARLREVEGKARAVEQHLQSVSDLERRVRVLLSGGRPGGPARGQVQAASPQGGRAIPASAASGGLDLGAELDQGRARLSWAERLLRGRLDTLAAVPSTPPGLGAVTSYFGVRSSPFGGRRSEFHDGLDLDLPYGTPVRAAAGGTVASAAGEPAYGLTVTLRHGHGFTSRYSHLSATTVQPGQQVRRGEVLGRVGSSGRSTGPHLHFMVLRNGQAQDPLGYLVGP